MKRAAVSAARFSHPPMVFSTPIFLTVFLPLVLAGYVAIGLAVRAGARAAGRPFSWRPANAWLLATSLGFYFWGEGWGVGWLAASVLFNAACAKILSRREGAAWRRGWLAANVTGNLLFLGWFKYAGFAVRSLDLLPGVSLPVPEVALPLGISFYTFQAMSYVWDVYRRDVETAPSLVDFACYVTMFPQLVAGPIVRYADVAAQLQARSVPRARLASGWRRFLAGLAKKILVANTVAAMADAVWAQVTPQSGVSAPMAWLGLLCYTLQIYYDFSGYSDMAIGLGRMFGFEFLENFRHPYASRSVQEFWRRWHISLSTWFRDYVYIPLGGNRKGGFRTGLNCLLVFGLCGLWHGASAMFLLWGLWHGFFLMTERLFRPAKGGHAEASRPWLVPLGQVYTLLVVMAGWVLFRSDTLAQAGMMFQSLAGLAMPTPAARTLWLEWSPKLAGAILAGVLFAWPVAPWVCGLAETARNRLAGGWRAGAECAWHAGAWVVLTLLGALAALFMAGSAYNPFIYFRF